jgi:DNA polymerase IIIc chi subunit
MATPETRVILFQVRDALSKRSRLIETAQAQFAQKERLLILVEDDKALTYVDELLWKLPEESFLPHAIQETECQDWIALSKGKKNVNSARVAFNLCPTPLLLEGFRLIFDFEDLSSPNKKMFSQLRFDAYKQARFSIEART